MNRLRIAIAAGELSGDQLAAQIILELQQQFPGCEIVGIAGDAMVKWKSSAEKRVKKGEGDELTRHSVMGARRRHQRQRAHVVA